MEYNREDKTTSSEKLKSDHCHLCFWLITIQDCDPSYEAFFYLAKRVLNQKLVRFKPEIQVVESCRCSNSYSCITTDFTSSIIVGVGVWKPMKASKTEDWSFFHCVGITTVQECFKDLLIDFSLFELICLNNHSLDFVHQDLNWQVFRCCRSCNSKLIDFSLRWNFRSRKFHEVLYALTI